MTILPVVSGMQVIKALHKVGFVVLRQKGRHVRLKKVTPIGTIKITVPNEKVVKKDTLRSIIKEVNLYDWNSKLWCLCTKI
ncbi:MAG: type II toxin-antitoxin system HicA family toxin [Methanosarcinales archaeon]